MFDRLVTLTALPWSEKALVVESLWELAFARGLIKTGLFKKWKKRLGKATATPDGCDPPQPVDAQIEAAADAMGRVIRKVARNAPFKANCLPQASAAQIMLKRRGIIDGKLFIGGRKGTKDDPLDLHAWLYVGQICVTGNDGPGDLTSFKPLIRYDLNTGEG